MGHVLEPILLALRLQGAQKPYKILWKQQYFPAFHYKNIISMEITPTAVYCYNKKTMLHFTRIEEWSQVDIESHPGILNESNNNNDCNNGEKEDGWHDTLDAADGRVTGLIKLTVIGTAILCSTKVRWREHGNNSLWKSFWSFNYAVHNNNKQNLTAAVWRTWCCKIKNQSCYFANQTGKKWILQSVKDYY